MRCKQPKAYAFCGSHTVVGIQWYFDHKHSKCLPFKYCMSNEDSDIPYDSIENRFEDEIQCVYICKKYGLTGNLNWSCSLIFRKKIPPGKKDYKANEKPSKIRQSKELEKNPTYDKPIDKEERSPEDLKKLDRYESEDPTRCMKPKSYSFCGAHTVPRIHWYYNKKTRRCFPYHYCEGINETPTLNNQNNFLSEKQCLNLCKKYFKSKQWVVSFLNFISPKSYVKIQTNNFINK